MMLKCKIGLESALSQTMAFVQIKKGRGRALCFNLSSVETFRNKSKGQNEDTRSCFTNLFDSCNSVHCVCFFFAAHTYCMVAFFVVLFDNIMFYHQIKEHVEACEDRVYQNWKLLHLFVSDRH